MSAPVGSRWYARRWSTLPRAGRAPRVTVCRRVGCWVLRAVADEGGRPTIVSHRAYRTEYGARMAARRLAVVMAGGVA